MIPVFIQLLEHAYDTQVNPFLLVLRRFNSKPRALSFQLRHLKKILI